MKKRWFKLYLYSFIITFAILALSGAVYYVSATLLRDPASESIIKGQQALEEDNLTLAEKHFKNAIKSNESSVEGRIGLAETYAKKGDVQDAVDVLKKGISISLGAYEYYEKVIQIYTENGMMPDARSFINSIVNQFVTRKLRENMPSAVTASPEPGQFDKAVSVKLSSSEEAKIYYTLDGSQPTIKSTLYSGKDIKIDKTVTLRAFSVNDKLIPSETEFSGSYIVVQTNKKYDFADRKVEAIVRAALNQPDKDITYKQILSIRKLSNRQTEENPIEGAILSLNDIAEMKNLSELSLEGEQVISDYSPLSSLPVLRTLSLTGCSISNTSFKALASCTMLISLDLSGNTISDITQISGMINLSYLSLSNNMISDISPLAALTSLKTLDVSRNIISNPAALSSLTSLTAFHADHNQITDISAFSNLNALTDFTISNNRIPYIPDMAGLRSLKHLDISNNIVGSLVPLAVCSSLESLDIKANAVTDLAPISNLKLSRLIAAKNHISNLVPVASIRQLKVLDISDNLVSDVSPLSALPLLETVYISNNDIWDIEPLGSIPSLRELYCSNTNISDFSYLNKNVVRIYK